MGSQTIRNQARTPRVIVRNGVRSNMLRTMRPVLPALALLIVAGCSRPEPLTAAKAEEIVSRWSFEREPVYAEVPQRVWWSASAPMDDYDAKAVRTLRNLEKAGLVTVTESREGGTTSYVARVTRKGFPILGTAPSVRGPVYRGLICQKRYDGLRNFARHPTEPTVGAAELYWHYETPTPLYPLFETKIDKPLDHPFATLVSFHWEKGTWHFGVTAEKVEPIDD